MMTSTWTRADVPFLVEAMDARLAKWPVRTDTGATDKVSGDMSVPRPVTVDANGTMTEADYKACSTIMMVSQNMVQKTLTAAAQSAGIEPADALKNMNAWVKAYVDFPFPFFNFKDTQSDVQVKDAFSLKTDADTVESIVNIKNVPGLKEAVIGALRKSGGELASYAGTERKFNYFGIITGYNATEIAVRVIKFQMNLKSTNVESLCVTYEQTHLDSAYDTYQFVADKEMMIKMQAKMGDKLIDFLADQFLEFLKIYYEEAMKAYQQMLTRLLKPAS